MEETGSRNRQKLLVRFIRILALPFKYKAASGILSFATVLACIYVIKGVGVQLSVSLILAIVLLIILVAFYLAYLSAFERIHKRLTIQK